MFISILLSVTGGDDDVSDSSDTVLLQIDHPVCQRLVSVVMSASELVQSAVPPGPSRDNIVKVRYAVGIGEMDPEWFCSCQQN